VLSDSMTSEILNALKPIDVERLILFGSYAWGIPDKNSDIDLYVVTKDDFMPESWSEKSKVYLKIIEKFDLVQKQVPVDLIVHTKPMHEKFVKLNSLFCRKILRDGIVLI